MSVSLEDVHHFAALAKLRLTAEEAEALRGDLNRILAHVDHLADLPVDGDAEGEDLGGADPAPAPRPSEPHGLAYPPADMAPVPHVLPAGQHSP